MRSHETDRNVSSHRVTGSDEPDTSSGLLPRGLDMAVGFSVDGYLARSLIKRS